MIGLAGYMYNKYKNCPDTDRDCQNTTIRIDGNAWGLVGLCMVGGALAAAFWLEMIKRYANCLIWFCLLFSVAMFFVMGIVCFAMGAAVPGVIMLILGGLNALYVYFVRNRIEFSATILTIVVEVLKKFPASYWVAYASVLAQAVWMLIWVIGAGSTLNQLEKDKSSQGNQGFVYFIFLVSFYWSSQVIKNVVHVTVSGVLGTWYFLYPANAPPSPTSAAFKRATTTSFGSICLGSLIIAVIRALRTMVRAAKDNKNEWVRCIVLCFLNCLDSLVTYFNVYAFTQVAIYGKTYCEAATATWQLLKSRGIDAIINDDLIGTVLTFGALIGGLVVAVIGAVCAKWVVVFDPWGIWAAIGFLIGFAMTLICMEVVQSAVCALFVCFAEDPQALNDTKPEVYAKFRGALANHRYASNMPLLA
jgi:hypothetical protein